MADYSTAATNAQTALESAVAAGGVEEYQIGDRRVKRAAVEMQVKNLAMLNGLAARAARGGVCTLAKLQEGAT